MHNVRLASGNQMPILGLGTWQLNGTQCERIVTEALALGYTHIDTAWIYQNQRAIGNAIRHFRIQREQLFITTKIWNTHLRYNDVLSQCEECLRELQMDYVDMLLIHWPSHDVPFSETLTAFKELYDAGKVKNIGISNFSIAQVNEACNVSALPICMNQVEYHVRCKRNELRNYCFQRQIGITAYSPLAQGTSLNDIVLKDIARQKEKKTAQVALRWLIQQGIVAIPKSASAKHLRNNLDVFTWELTDADMQTIGC